MSTLTFLALAVAGGLGAMSRYSIDGFIRARVSDTTPWGTITINLTGSLALGLLAGLTAALVLPAAALAIAGTGFLGGYTTFSTASTETVNILRDGRIGSGIVVGTGTLVAATLLAGFGLWIGSNM